MNNIIRRLLIFVFLTPFILAGQNSFIIQSKSASSKTRELKTNRTYTIKTLDTIYYHKRLISLTDTSLKTTKNVKTQDSTMTIRRYPNQLANDTTYEKVWRTDTFEISFRKLIYLEKSLCKNTKWAEPFLYIGVGAALGTILIPIIAVAYGPDEAKEAAVPIISTLAICATAVFFATRTITYDMQDDWKFIRTKATTR
jgi:hypothetical protein